MTSLQPLKDHLRNGILSDIKEFGTSFPSQYLADVDVRTFDCDVLVTVWIDKSIITGQGSRTTQSEEDADRAIDEEFNALKASPWLKEYLEHFEEGPPLIDPMSLKHVSDATADYAQTCDDCRGNGEINCPDCKGTTKVDCPNHACFHGQVACGYCPQDNRPCSYCLGTRKLRCNSCSGGKQSCSRCFTGTVTCQSCEGLGKRFFRKTATFMIEESTTFSSRQEGFGTLSNLVGVASQIAQATKRDLAMDQNGGTGTYSYRAPASMAYVLDKKGYLVVGTGCAEGDFNRSEAYQKGILERLDTDIRKADVMALRDYPVGESAYAYLTAKKGGGDGRHRNVIHTYKPQLDKIRSNLSNSITRGETGLTILICLIAGILPLAVAFYPAYRLLAGFGIENPIALPLIIFGVPLVALVAGIVMIMRRRKSRAKLLGVSDMGFRVPLKPAVAALASFLMLPALAHQVELPGMLSLCAAETRLNYRLQCGAMTAALPLMSYRQAKVMGFGNSEILNMLMTEQ